MNYTLEFYKEGILCIRYLFDVHKFYNDGGILTFLNKKKEIIFVVNAKHFSHMEKF